MNEIHQCGVPTGNGWCATFLDKYHPRCEKHEVCVIRGKGERIYTSAGGVKNGDRIINGRLQ